MFLTWSPMRSLNAANAAEYAIKRIDIFGFFARGEVNEDRDVDVVFETDSPNLFRTAEGGQNHAGRGRIGCGMAGMCLAHAVRNMSPPKLLNGCRQE